jgi:ribonuclease HII
MPDISLETKLWSKGYRLVVGIDEAGRGPWAGPVTAGAVLIDKNSEILKPINDSKKMSKKIREEMFDQIKESVVAWGIGTIDANLIDEIGIQFAVQQAMSSALDQVERMIKAKAEYLIIDGSNVLEICGYDQTKIIKGDMKHYSIAAGSVLAKVHRDQIMEEYSEKYPEYGFESHVGYGTRKHREALEEYGPCEIHRKSFKPILRLNK